MTFKSLMNLGNLNDPYHPGIDRYHSGSDGYHHGEYGGYYHGSRGSNKNKNDKGAALSALTLLAFLFLLNVMQQSMQENNNTVPTTTSTIFLRDIDQPIMIDSKEEEKRRDEMKKDGIITVKSKIQRLNSQYIK
ncbi:uncharacterized protein LOC102676158 [Apis dorsata]|uniref:uncharacterized protein LOC102676158 n=1 Tax=Apis dorsata TaxID=7462 RepID=UPI0003DF60A0|nr:uncharacterized protein LOC102676158 [Apis dorsata]